MKRLVVLIAMAVALVPVRPAVALAPGIHGFALTATPATYPCINPFCSGPLGGLGTAVVTGLSTSSQSFVATWPDPTRPPPTSNTSGNIYNLDDSCPVGGPTLSPTGTGNINFTLSGGQLAYQGQELSGATLTGYASFERYGTDLVLFVSSATVQAPNGTVIAVEASLEDGLGDGGWTVMSGLATCGAPLTKPQVQITATYLAPE